MRDIKRVVVLGANGTMGSGAAGLFAGRGFEVAMLARTKEKAGQGLERAKQALRADAIGSAVTLGDYDHDLEREVAKADLVLEAVSEDLEVKKQYFQRVDRARRAGTVVATVSSGLSIDAMAEGRSSDFGRFFMGIHLFNPPHVIVGTELIPGSATDQETFRSIGSLLRKRLGRAVVECRDQPAFAGNRVGFKVLNECAQLAQEHGVSFIDYLVGSYTGRAMPPLATIDLVGWDVHRAIVDNIYDKTDDEAHDNFALPKYMRTLVERGHLGTKTPAQGGFFRRDSQGAISKLVLDPVSCAYVEPPAIKKLGFIEEIKQLHRVGRYRDAMALFLRAEGPEARLAQRVILGYVSYALHRVGPAEVVDHPSGVDGIMSQGFNWAPPSALVDLFGARETIASMDALGIPVPKVLAQLPAGQSMFREQDKNVGRYFIGK